MARKFLELGGKEYFSNKEMEVCEKLIGVVENDLARTRIFNRMASLILSLVNPYAKLKPFV